MARLASVLLLVCTCVDTTAGSLTEQDSSYQWRLCPAGRLLPIRPGYTDPATATDSTEIRADSSRLVEDGISQFNGDVEVIRGGHTLRAEVVTYDDNSGLFTAEGRTHIWDSGLLWVGESAVYDLEAETSTLNDGRYSLLSGRGQGHADLIEHDRVTDITILEGVDYSTCPQSDEAWRISATKIKLNHVTDRGSATNAVLRVRNVPVFYFPYVNFPISDKRKSGFLAPSVGTTNDSGTDFQVPYYWNIAPNYDATITPRVLTDRGAMLGSEVRYLGQNFRGEINGEYLPGDDLREGQDRSVVKFEHSHTFLDRKARLRVLFNNVSDDEYFEDFGGSISSTSQRFLDRRMDFRLRSGRTYFTALAQSYQTVDDTLPSRAGPYRRLPQLTLRHNFGALRRFQPAVRTEATYFDKDGLVSGGRVDVEPSLTYLFIKPFVDIRPRLSMRHTQYFLDDPEARFDDSESRSIPTFSIDAKLFAERSFSLFGEQRLQTFEPRVFYLLVPNVEQDQLPRFDGGLLDVSFRNIFRENRFSGGDRVGDANQVTTAVTSRILDTENGREAFRISVGQIYYFRDRVVTLPNGPVREDSQSELIAEAAANIGSDWSLRGTVQWDPGVPRTEKSAVSLRYRPNLETVVNMSYRFRRAVSDIEQGDISFRVPLLDSFALLGRWNYSLPDKRTLEAVAGIEYESCCWGLRLVGRRFLRNGDGEFDSGVFLQFQFRGLGGVGQKSDSLLRRGIPGWEDPFD